MTLTEEEKVLRCAKAAHNALVLYCKSLGDFSIKEWDDAEQWQREDTVAMVRSTLRGTHSPEEEHGRWFKGKVDRGYVYGPEKNDDPAKGPLTNPNMLPYYDLPLSARMKDNLLIVTVVAVAAHYDLVVSKIPKMVFEPSL